MKNDSPHYLGHDMKSNLKVYPYRQFSSESPLADDIKEKKIPTVITCTLISTLYVSPNFCLLTDLFKISSFFSKDDQDKYMSQNYQLKQT